MHLSKTKTLFDATSIKQMKLKNRIIRSAMWLNMADDSGRPTPEFIKVYENLAKHDVGLILTGYAYINKEDQPSPGMLGIYDDAFIPYYQELTKSVHQYEGKIALQITSGGSQNSHPNKKEMMIFGPSAIKNRVTGITPIEASKDDIKNIVKQFAQAAQRAKESGFDAIEIYAANGYFLSQFLTPYYNRRTDEYGGSILNRARIILEVIDAIRQQVGESFPLMIKINFDDFMDEGEGLTSEESLEVFKAIDAHGVDMIEISAVNESSGKGLLAARKNCHKPKDQSYFKDIAIKVASQVKAKVILLGGNRDVGMMEDILNQSNLDYVSIGRPFLCEPDLISKWKKNKNYTPRCVSCNKCWETCPNSCIFHRKK